MRRKSGVGGEGKEERRAQTTKANASRRRSEAGVEDMVEHRRLLKKEEEDAARAAEAHAALLEAAEAKKKTNKRGSTLAKSASRAAEEVDFGSESSSSEDESSDEDADEARALDAAVAAGLKASYFRVSDDAPATAAVGSDDPAAPEGAIEPRRRVKAKQALDAAVDPSPYLRTHGAHGTVTVRPSALLKRGKGSSVDIVALADRSGLYDGASSGARHGDEAGGTLEPPPLLGAAGACAKKARLLEANAGKVLSGKGWFDLPATEMSEALAQDLRAVRMRGALDPKRFYKALDVGKSQSKFVQVGTVVGGREDHWTNKLARKDRKATLVEELMADERARAYTKRKYGQIQTAKQSGKKFGPKKAAKMRTGKQAAKH